MPPPPAVVRPSTKLRLRESHAQVDVLLGQLLGLCEDDPVRARELWEQAAGMLETHLEGEDRDLLPALLRANPRDGYVLLQEHRHIRARVAELGVALATSIPVENIRNFRDELNAHARTESRLLYGSGEPPSVA